MGQSLADRGDGDELIDTKVGYVHSTDKDLLSSKLCFNIGNGLQPAEYAVKI